LRVEEDLADVAAYILANPIRAGLAAQPGDCLLLGGEYFEADGAEAPSLRQADGGTDGGEPADGASAFARGESAPGGRGGPAFGGKAPSLRPLRQAASPAEGGSRG
jgi:hypothetical protein